MPTKSWRGRCFVVAALSVAGLGWGSVRPVLGSPQQGGAAGGAQATGPTKLYFGVAACIDCHRKGTDIPDAVCTCKEVDIWEKGDKHKFAYIVLQGDRAKRMGELLKINPTEHAACLTCHGVYIADEKLREESKKVLFKPEEGVSCVACHGPYKEWVGRHSLVTERPNWQPLTREEKEKQGGMYDLWNPVKRTAVCASCHLGNAQENKVVTHDMYAAGHPPLPGFEIATFDTVMPRHWQLLRDKSPAAQKRLQYDGTTLEQTKLVTESGAADLRDAMLLLATEAKKCAEKGAEQALDLATFDCYACHHDLKTPSWRQKRGYTGAPGRPQFRPWPAALVRLGIRQAAQVDESRYKKYSQDFADGLKKLHEAFNAKPYGDCKQVAAAAEQLAQFASGLLAEAAKPKYDEAAARQLLKELVTPPGVVDYDSARQIAWAFRIIYQEVNPKAAPDSRVKKALEALDQELHLELPAGQKLNIIEELDKTLSKVAAYDPDKFSEKLKQLAAALNGEMR